MSVAGLLNRKAVVVRRGGETDDGQGGQTSGRTIVGTVDCRASQPSTVEMRVAEQEQRRIDDIIYAAHGSDLMRDDWLYLDGEIDGDEVTGGRLLRVDALIEPSEPIYVKAECTEVEAST